ncbi:MAG: threonine--tRNA ligase [Candidatus Competibacterales bacterium]|nr:threonine--tRNA ligase [Candidatus Competibacterales bacterium]
MPIITLPDGSQKTFDRPVTGFDLAASIGPGLAKAAVAMEVDGEQCDLSTTLAEDARVRLLTPRDADGLDVLRHTLAAQVLARAVKDLYPEARLAIGPTIDTGFYYDVDFPTPIPAEDLERIETRMREIVSENLAISRELWPREQVAEYFRQRGEDYKVEIVRNAPPEETELSVYRQGRDGETVFIDLCRGPHLPNLGRAGNAFKLTSLAGAYWRGDSNNPMLTRIYGTAWPSDKELKQHLRLLEEAEKRDHRKLGRQLDLFHTQEEAPGMTFWHPKGWTLWQAVEQYMRQVYRNSSFQEVRCPQILDVSLWKASGHWDNFKENMFFTASENRDYAVKPMNCPGHVQIFKQHLHSYRELPIRFGEFGSCHRNEPSGALHGLMRVRSFTQDDGHIFCTEDQIQSEVIDFIETLRRVYADFGFTDILYKLATRPDKRIGDDAVWDKAEQALHQALDAHGIDYQLNPGEGAFYGPKIEFSLRDALGRVWQCGTVQVDFSMPGRLGAEYVAEDSGRRTPVMLHRAIVGSMERFIGILVEHYAGHLPLWLAPVQAVAMGITDQQAPAVRELVALLREAGLRVEADLRNEKVSYKIREHSLQKIPLMLVLGQREIEQGTVTVRRFGSNRQTTLAVAELIERLRDEIDHKRLPAEPAAEAA